MVDNFQIEDMVEQTQRFVSYKAYNTESGRKCLLKRYLVDKTSGLGKVEGWQEEFLSIIEAFNRVEVPTLRTLISGGLDPQDGNPFAVFEWFEVSSLSEVIKDAPNLDLSLTKDMAKAALDAIGFLHSQGLVHGDISPQSVFYTDSQEKNPWVLNWDPIRALRCKHGVNRFGMNIYIAPELTAGGPPNAQSDLYALGKAVEKVAGKNAQEPNIAQWISVMTAMEPSHRYQTSAQAQEHLPEEEVNVSAPSATEAPTSAPKQTRLLVGAQSPPAVPNAPLLTTSGAAASQGGAPAPASKVAPRVAAPAKAKGGNGAVITLGSLIVLTLGVVGFLLWSKKEQPKVATVASEAETTQAQSASSEPQNTSEEEVLDPDEVIPAGDFNKLGNLVGRKVTVSGKVVELSKQDGVLELYLTGRESQEGVFKVQVDDSKTVSSIEDEALQKAFIGKEVKVEGELERKFNYEQRIYLIYQSKLKRVIDVESGAAVKLK